MMTVLLQSSGVDPRLLALHENTGPGRCSCVSVQRLLCPDVVLEPGLLEIVLVCVLRKLDQVQEKFS